MTLLPTPADKERVSFLSADSKESFDAVKKRAPPEWRYHTKSITYDMNKHGYRTLEFDDIKWSDSIVIIGCSVTLGIGLATDETISSMISNKVDREVINLGVGGASMLYSMYNASLLKKHYPPPYGVIYAWPHPSRLPFKSDNGIHYLGTWTKEHAIGYDMYRAWNGSEENMDFHAEYIKLTSEIMWDGVSKYLSFDLYKHLIEWKTLNTGILNRARDTLHASSEFSEIASSMIVEKMEKW